MRPPRRRKANKLSLIVLGCFLVLLGGAAFTAFKTLTFVNSVSTAGLGDNIKSVVANAVPELGPSPSAGAQGQLPNRVNVLLLGYGGVGHDGALLTDSLMVLTYDRQTKKAAMISVPRDIWVRVPASPGDQGGFYKLNTAYAIGADDDSFPNKQPQYKAAAGGGGNLAATVVGGILGMKIDYWVAVDFHAFKSMVDALGGVDVKVEKTFTDYEYPRNDDPSVDSSWMTVHFDAGEQHMNGERAIEFARSRHSLEDGTDFGRSRRQQLILLAIKSKALSPEGMSKAFGLMDALSKDFKTNMTIGQVKALAEEAKDVDPNTIDRVSIDTTNYLADAVTTDGQDVLVPQGKSWSALRSYIGSLLLDPAVKTEGAKIQLWNGSGSPGAAGTATSMLNDLGLQTLPPQNMATQGIQQNEVHDFSQGRDPSTVSYLAGLFGAKVVTDTPSPSDQADIKVVLGKSYQASTTALDSYDPSLRPYGYTPPAPVAPAPKPAASPAPSSSAEPKASAAASSEPKASASATAIPAVVRTPVTSPASSSPPGSSPAASAAPSTAARGLTGQPASPAASAKPAATPTPVKR